MAILRHSLKVVAPCSPLWFLPLIFLGLWIGWNNVSIDIGILFSKAAMVTFGGAYAVLAYISQQAVSHYGWIQPEQMIDGPGLADYCIGISRIYMENDVLNGNDQREDNMKWITREKVKVDRVACPWLIRRFIDRDAEFLFVPADEVMETAEMEKAIPFDIPNVELGHHGGKCSFEAILAKYRIEDAAVLLLAEIVHGADVAQDMYSRPEAPGLKAIAEGFRYLHLKDDHEILEREFIVYDALYAYCRQRVLKG